MKIEFLGHAAFLITTSAGRKIVTDPYEPGGFGGAIAYGPLKEAADFVTISHEHADHNYVKMVPGSPRVIRGTGEETHDGILFRALSTHHDKSRGAERGGNVVRVIEADEIALCHLGDLGHALAPEDATALGAIDVLLVPVGGTFTVDAKGATAIINRLRPRIAIPMHFRTPKVSFDIAPVDEVEVNKDSLPEPTEIVVLEPAL
jgi:L-ascorbate metabolism protein UlaG (beta-lactamase superfamily)